MAEACHGLVDGKEYNLIIGSSFRQKQNDGFYHSVRCKYLLFETSTILWLFDFSFIYTSCIGTSHYRDGDMMGLSFLPFFFSNE